MVVVGVDAHKRTHTCVAVDGSGRKVGEKTVPATTVGNASALRWALSTFGPDLTWVSKMSATSRADSSRSWSRRVNVSFAFRRT